MPGYLYNANFYTNPGNNSSTNENKPSTNVRSSYKLAQNNNEKADASRIVADGRVKQRKRNMFSMEQTRELDNTFKKRKQIFNSLILGFIIFYTNSGLR